MMAMPDSTSRRVVKLASATVPSVIAMISAERMKSVRMAPATVFASCSGLSSPVLVSSSSAS